MQRQFVFYNWRLKKRCCSLKKENTFLPLPESHVESQEKLQVLAFSIVYGVRERLDKWSYIRV